jgi:hypothetical protein
MGDDREPLRGGWARRVRRNWPTAPAETDVERLERELQEARRTIVARDIEIAGLQAQLQAPSEPSADDGP